MTNKFIKRTMLIKFNSKTKRVKLYKNKTLKKLFQFKENFVFCTTNDGIFNAYSLLSGKKNEKNISSFERTFNEITKFYAAQSTQFSFSDKG